MRSIFIAVPLLSVSLLAARSVVVPNEAHAIVKKAIDAHGGMELLSTFPANKIKAHGWMTLNGCAVPFSVRQSVQAPNDVMVMQYFGASSPGHPRCKLIAQHGDRVRLFLDQREVLPVPPTEAAWIRNALHVQTACGLVPLLGSSYKLSMTDEGKVCGRPAWGIRVACDGKKDIVLYFDKGTSMLVKSEYLSRDADGHPVSIEEVYMNFQCARGVMYPTKTQVFVQGRLHCEHEVTEFIPVAAFDAGEFALP